MGEKRATDIQWDEAATPAARPEYSARRVHEAALEAARALRGEQTTMGFDA